MTFRAGRSHQPERRTALLQLWAGLERGRPPGDAGDPVRDRLGEQDLHRHPRRLCLARTRCVSTTAPASTGGTAGQPLRQHQPARPRDLYRRRLAAAVPRLGAEGPGTDPRLLPPVARPTRRAASASIPTRASACSAISPRAAGPAVRTAYGAASVPGTGPRTDPPRRARGGAGAVRPGLRQGRPPPTGRSRPRWMPKATG